MFRRRYRTLHVAHLDRLMAEAEAIRRAVDAGATNAWVQECDRIVDGSGDSVWRVVLRVSPRRRRAPDGSLGGGVRKK